VIDPLAVASYERLLATLGLPPDLAQGTAQYVRAGQSSIGGGAGSTGANEFGAAGSTAAAQAATAAAGGPSAGALPLPLSSLSGLLDVPGYTPAMIVRLAPFVTVLPVATPVNVNTAPAEVLVAVIPGLSLTAAQTVVAERTKAYFRDTGDLQTLLAASGVSLPSGNTLSVRSQFFIVHADIQHERAEMHRDTLIYRAGPNPNSTRIISAQDIY
jgi:general secretion pathway protein K